MSDSFVTPQTIASQAPLSMGFPRQGYWGELPFPSPGDLPAPEIKPSSSALAGGFFTIEPPGKPPFNTRKFSITHVACIIFLSDCLAGSSISILQVPRMEVVEPSLVTLLSLLSFWHFPYSPHPIFFSHACLKTSVSSSWLSISLWNPYLKKVKHLFIFSYKLFHLFTFYLFQLW